MLGNLRTIYKPATLEEAAERLQHSGSYPVYGSGASLIRRADPAVETAVDVSHLVESTVSIDADGTLTLGTAATLASLCDGPLAEFDSTTGNGLSQAILAELPLTLRNALTLGDVLVEHNTSSILLTMLSGLQTELRVFDGVNQRHFGMRMRDWFGLVESQRRRAIVLDIICTEYTLWRSAFEKVSRTPADAPIVVAVAFANPERPEKSAFSIVGGLTDHPAHYIAGMQATLSDYKGSAEYRTEMAHVLSERALTRAIEMARLN